MWYAIGVFVAFVVAIMLANSFRLLKPDEAAEIYLFGSHVCTQYPWDFRQSLTSDQQAVFDSIVNKRIWWLDIVFALYPFQQIIKFSTSGTKAQFHAADIFTKGDELFPRVELHADPVFTPRFFTIRWVIRGIGLPSVSNLEHMCTIGEKGDHIHYKDTVLASLFREQVQDLFLEGLRQAASAFIWSSNTPSKMRSGKTTATTVNHSEREIVSSKGLWEKLTLFILASPESLFAQARILKRPTLPAWKTTDELLLVLEKMEVKDFYDMVASVDINITGLDLAAESENASPAQKAVNQQFIKMQEAKGEKSIGVAKAEVTERQAQADAVRIKAVGNAQLEVAKKMAAQPGVDPNAVLLGQMVGENVKDINVTGIGASLTETLANALKGKATP